MSGRYPRAEPGTSSPPLVSGLEVGGDTLTVRPGPEFKRRWLGEDFFATYDGADLGSLDAATLLTPFLLNVAPIVWLSGETYAVGAVDSRLAAALEDVRTAFQRLYPATSWDGRLLAETAPPRPHEEGRERDPSVAVLFSGGVDSVYTSLASPGSQLLVTVRGSDVSLDDEPAWLLTRRRADEFARAFGHRSARVESNFQNFLRVDRLNRASPEIPDWWSYIQHGIGLIGLTAPVLAHWRCTRLLIAATLAPTASYSWGSHPDLDRRVAWNGLSVDHHGDDVTRQEKLRFIAGVARDRGRPVPLRVCYSGRGRDGRNCCRCEKCLRTAAGLLVEGEDPRPYGFDRPVDEIVKDIRRRFRFISMELDAPGHVARWKEIQAAAGPAGSGPGGSLARWLRRIDLDRYGRRRALRLATGERARAAVRRSPLLYPLLRGIRRLVRGRTLREAAS